MRSVSRGFTLIELMVVVVIAAVMLALGVPSFKDFIAGQRIKTAASDFAMAAIHARSEAIKRNADADAGTGVSVVAAGTGWKDGWQIKFGAVKLGEQTGYPALTMTMTPSGVAQIVYGKDGRLKASTPSPLTLEITSDGSASARCVSFDLSGLPKIRSGNCS